MHVLYIREMLTYYLVMSSISTNISQCAEKLEFSFRKDSNSKVNEPYLDMNNKSERKEELLNNLPSIDIFTRTISLVLFRNIQSVFVIAGLVVSIPPIKYTLYKRNITHSKEFAGNQGKHQN